MSLAASLAGLAWFGANAAEYGLYAAALSRPAATQRRVLSRILRRNAATAFGRMHRLEEIRGVADYRSRVPLSTYADYRPWIDRIMAGDEGVLTRSHIRVLEPSSGSVSAVKLIPCTADLQREFRRAIAPWIVDLYRARPRLMGGPGYWSITPVTRESSAARGRIRVGFEEDSEYLGGIFRRIVGATLAVPPDVRFIQDVEVFRYVTLLFLLKTEGLRLISVWHPTFLTLLLSDLQTHWTRLLRDLENGSLDPPRPLPAPLRAALGSRLRPRPERAARLRRLRPVDFERVWPRLGLVSCWGDAHASHSLRELRRAFPTVEIQPKGLLATEAFVTLPFRGAYPLAIRSHFFEFLAGDETYLAHEITPGRTYSVVVTTGGGLYRYRLEDRVEVTGFVGRTPSLRFLGKEDHVSDLRGEKLSETFVAATLRRVLDDAGVVPRFALLAPEVSGHLPRYTLYLECDGDPPASLAGRLETGLEANPLYRDCVALGQLAPLGLFRITGGGQRSYIERCRAGGQRLGNIKPLALSVLTDWSESFKGRYLDEAPGTWSSLPADVSMPR